MKRFKKVAVIGAGPSGLTAIKCCKEAGFVPVCFEKNGDPGGLWRYCDEEMEGVASVMKTTTINTSKEMSAFSDFPPPEDYPNFMHHSKLYSYFMMYAKHFDLLKHIRYNSEVNKVEKSKDHVETGRWTITLKSTQTEVVTKEDFDAVMVCIGHHVYPNVPTFPGQEKFSGIIMHSHSLKSCEGFSGKNITVIGIGNSGADAAVDATFSANNVYLSTRRGSWILSRIGPNGRPYDMDFYTRWNNFLISILPFNTVCSNIEQFLNEKFDHEVYKLKPKHRVFSAHPTMNDALPNCILSGRIVIKGDVQRFEENGIIFDGDNELTEVDVVILATGYQIKFPFLGDLVNIQDNKVSLYKYVIPPNLEHPTLAIIGLIQPEGPIFPVAEMQCRWFLQLCLGNINLPSPKNMLKDIKARDETNAERYISSARHTIQADFIPYMDELASQFGVKPNLFKLAISDPKLFSSCLNGPCLPYQYRLRGPNSWSGARDAILNYEKRVFSALNTDGKTIPKPQQIKYCKLPSANSSASVILGLFIAVIIFIKKHYNISFLYIVRIIRCTNVLKVLYNSSLKFITE